MTRWRSPPTMRNRPSMVAAKAFGISAFFESATARSKNLAAYGEPDAADLAAAYAFEIARNHPFVDGNKRTAAVVSETFLRLNGYRLEATDAQLVVQFLALAAGEVEEEEMAAWFQEHIASD